jgi:glycosyltransferase involved in cell wall biosynthesis
MTLSITHVLLSLHIGGGERVALELARMQAADGHRVSVVSFERANVEVVCIPKRAGFDWTLPPRLLRHFRARRPDVVHTHNPLPLIYAAAPARAARARVIHTKHGPHPDRALRLWLRRGGAACTSAFVAVSEDSGEFARRVREVAPSKLSIIENGTDTDAFHPDEAARAALRAELGIPADAFVVGTVGRMEDVKNHALLVRAVAPLLGERCHLVIAGGGSLERATAELAEALGVSAFTHLTGPTDAVARVLAGLDVFALSSKTEGLPLVIPEAMATELPVVATAVGGVPKVVVEGETGLLVPAGDEPALRDAIARLRDDPELVRRMGLRGRSLARERYSARRVAAEYMALYR